MAYVQLGKIGAGVASKLSVFRDNARAYSIESSGQSEGSNSIENLNVIYKVVGYNLNDLLLSAKVNDLYKLFTLNDGTYIGIKVTEVDLNRDHDSQYTALYDTVRVTFNHYSPDNRQITQLTPNNYSYAIGIRLTRKTDGAVIYGRSMLSICIDEEAKTAYWKLYASDGAYINFAFSTTHRAITHGYGSALYNVLTGSGVEYDANPWASAGYAGIGGGEGTFDFESDIVGLPDIPNIDATSTGFLQLYSGNLSQVRDLAGYLWTDDFLTNLVKVTQNPLDIIMSLYMYPFTIPSGTTKRVQAGNVETTVEMSVPNSQIFEVDCGVFPVPSFYGAYLDYEPFSKCELFLPYCGTYSISLDDVAGKNVNVRYRVDLLTGSCAAYVIVEGSVRYTFTGMCAVNIPITSQSFINNYSAILELVATGANALTAPTMAAASDVASNVMQCKPNISRGGSAVSNVGFMGIQTPVFTFTVPRVAIPKGQDKHTGYPVFSTYKLSDLTGYTEIESILTKDFGRATSAEVSEIERLLKGGVIL